MRSRTPSDLPGRCKRCWQHATVCFCGELPRLRLQTRIVIVRHVLEAQKPSNTARMAALVLERCEIVPYGAVGQPFEPDGLALEDGYLLYPGAGASTPSEPGAGPRTLVVPDGNWSQSRRMARRITERVPLRRLSLHAVPEAAVRMRREERPDTCSTIEAIAGALAMLEGAAGAHAADVLLRAHERMARGSLVVRGRVKPQEPPREGSD